MAKKALLLLALFALVFSAVAVSISGVAAADDPYLGSVVKLENSDTLYYIATNGKRYVYPNEKIYKSWYIDFSDIVTISQADLANYPLAGNILYRPGVILVKIETDPKVYALGQGGILRWVKTEQLAKRLYGDDWAALIDDLAPSFFASYTIGGSVGAVGDYNPAQEISTTNSVEKNQGLALGQLSQEKKAETVQCRAIPAVSADDGTPVTPATSSRSCKLDIINSDDTTLPPTSNLSNYSFDRYYGPCHPQATNVRPISEIIVETGKGLGTINQVDVLSCQPFNGPGGSYIISCPSQYTGYSYCVQNQNDGVGNSIIFGVKEKSSSTALPPTSNLSIYSFDKYYGPCHPQATHIRPMSEIIKEAGKDISIINTADVLACAPFDGPGGSYAITCPAQYTGYTYCVQNQNDGVGNSIIFGVKENTTAVSLPPTSPLSGYSFDGYYGPCHPQATNVRPKSEIVKETGKNLSAINTIDVLSCVPFNGPGGSYIVTCPSSAAGYVYCVQNQNDGVGNSIIFGVKENTTTSLPLTSLPPTSSLSGYSFDGYYGPCHPQATNVRPMSEIITGLGKDLSKVGRVDMLYCAPFDGPGNSYIVACPIQNADYTYCVQNQNDGVGNSVIFGVKEGSSDTLLPKAQVVSSYSFDRYYGPCHPQATDVRPISEIIVGLGKDLSKISFVEVNYCAPFDGPGTSNIVSCPIVNANYSYCVQNQNDGVGNSIILGIKEQ